LLNSFHSKHATIYFFRSLQPSPTQFRLPEISTAKGGKTNTLIAHGLTCCVVAMRVRNQTMLALG